jgi:hypothetical protein
MSRPNGVTSCSDFRSVPPPSGRSEMTFLEFLEKLKDERSDVSDFAHDALADPTFPSDISCDGDGESELMAYLKDRGAADDIIEAATTAWARYDRGEPRLPGDISYHERRDDDPLADRRVEVGWGKRKMKSTLNTAGLERRMGNRRSADVGYNDNNTTSNERLEVIAAAPETMSEKRAMAKELLGWRGSAGMKVI